ncbi:MAG: hypothetical protein A2087_03030 [Spirochaetes bacterium GWD1_61_31]|nr:MAG: hypothetical protein A2Y37_14125 [Spirochaetes bacterium GWB1_60_80]OHD34723.1 MAG: hypothetical protein A2004_00125 [Spirochaetes bacterium GWC1_61_12]OHD38743.1 MAG: hypothetical protein A2087_03030 [Spirochaetes bacterium GWD1_61_31]OHD44488.1 MAG: hypothetical protein A2Y35_04965 [Spirochaetes bacterium GWE1_60_18]OHD59362.1 MAG: hypothetical protein A2Y32_08530 [Spirochaetes bacterium GWF1_60_12]HAP43138.1 hypothetical protein [Spirochaetaceae bacterium]
MSPALIGVIVCLLFSALFSGVETAFTSLTVFQLEGMKKRGWAGALVARLARKPETLIATILVGNNTVNILASVLATEWVLQAFGSGALAAMTGILTFVMLVFSEVTPKRIAINHNEAIASLLSPFIFVATIVFKPAVLVVNGLSSLVTRFFSRPQKAALSMDTVIQMLSMAEHLGIIDYSRTLMVRNIFRLNVTTVQAIMTHRKDVFSLDKDMSCAEACRLLMPREHSRIPVFTGSTENITGVVTLHAIVNEVLNQRGQTRLAAISREPLFITHGKLAGQLFTIFKERKETFAVVIDEYGGLAGIVSVRDLIEEIVGIIYETRHEKSRERVGQQPDGSWLLAGETPLSLLLELSAVEPVESPPAQTVAGYVSWVLDRLPVQGDRLETELGEFQVIAMRANRVEQVNYRPPQA